MGKSFVLSKDDVGFGPLDVITLWGGERGGGRVADENYLKGLSSNQ